MASAFKTATSASIGTSLTTIYTCPSGTTSTIIGLYLCNQSGGAIEANVEFYGRKFIKCTLWNSFTDRDTRTINT